MFVVLSTKSSVPVGIGSPGALPLTVAVNVTDCPYGDGLADEVTVVRLSVTSRAWLNSDVSPVLRLVAVAVM